MPDKRQVGMQDQAKVPVGINAFVVNGPGLSHKPFAAKPGQTNMARLTNAMELTGANLGERARRLSVRGKFTRLAP